ncbi:MAG: hypothetical protein EG828_15545 [Deltaproteobacteria bacterium]|nr:hypothetical protein [Deltaproteobacteria bacterium]
MLRAVRFAASHDFEIEDEAWQAIVKLAPAITRVSPSRLYEEIQKLFLLGFAAPTFFLLEKSGLMASLFPLLNEQTRAEPGLSEAIEANLRSVDELVESGATVSPALLLTVLFGELIEKEAAGRHKDGVPRRQAFDASCAAFLEEIAKTAHIPGRVAGRLFSILALKSGMCKIPPRRPGTIAGRPEFPETLVYMSISARSHREYENILRWWENFISENPASADAVPPSDETPHKKRRRRRRRSRRTTEDQPGTEVIEM